MDLGIERDAIATPPQEPSPAPRALAEPVTLSLVIPAYNEEARLGETLAAAIAFLAPKPYRSEVLVVLDGCTDGTAAIAEGYAGGHGACQLRVIAMMMNRGKGACVKDGMLAAVGSYRFFTDADLSYPLDQLDRFLDTLLTEGGCAIASRDASIARYQSPLRRAVTILSRLVMRTVVVPGVSDTQAGFKGFTAEVARDLFATQRLSGFGFDAELLHLAHLRRYPIACLPVVWRDVPGSKVRVGRDVSRMLLELGAIAVHRALGRYRRRPEA